MIKELYKATKEELAKEIKMYQMYCARESLKERANFASDEEVLKRRFTKEECIKEDYEHLDLCKWVYHLRFERDE